MDSGEPLPPGKSKGTRQPPQSSSHSVALSSAEATRYCSGKRALPGPRLSARAARAERWRALHRGARDAERLILARLQVLRHAWQ
eukprot:859117-Alexandrium_andersonii.AAC.1